MDSCLPSTALFGYEHAKLDLIESIERKASLMTPGDDGPNEHQELLDALNKLDTGNRDDEDNTDSEDDEGNGDPEDQVSNIHVVDYHFTD